MCKKITPAPEENSVNYAELKFAMEHGIIDPLQIKSQIDMSKRQDYLNAHPYDIWQGNNGQFYTYIPDRHKGRVQRKSVSRKRLEDQIVEYQKMLEKVRPWKSFLIGGTTEDLQTNKSHSLHIRVMPVFSGDISMSSEKRG